MIYKCKYTHTSAQIYVYRHAIVTAIAITKETPIQMKKKIFQLKNANANDNRKEKKKQIN